MNKFTTLGLVALASVLTFSSLAHADNDNRRNEWRHNRQNNTGTVLTGAHLDCVRTALTTREAGVRSAYSTLSTTLLAGLDTRAAALNTAWTLTDRTARKSAIDTAWSGWNSTAKSAREGFKKSRKSTWETFRNSVKACKVSSNEVESNSAMNQDVQ